MQKPSIGTSAVWSDRGGTDSAPIHRHGRLPDQEAGEKELRDHVCWQGCIRHVHVGRAGRHCVRQHCAHGQPVVRLLLQASPQARVACHVLGMHQELHSGRQKGAFLVDAVLPHPCQCTTQPARSCALSCCAGIREQWGARTDAHRERGEVDEPEEDPGALQAHAVEHDAGEDDGRQHRDEQLVQHLGAQVGDDPVQAVVALPARERTRS